MVVGRSGVLDPMCVAPPIRPPVFQVGHRGTNVGRQMLAPTQHLWPPARHDLLFALKIVADRALVQRSFDAIVRKLLSKPECSRKLPILPAPPIQSARIYSQQVCNLLVSHPAFTRFSCDACPCSLIFRLATSAAVADGALIL